MDGLLYSSQKIGFVIAWQLSHKETIFMKFMHEFYSALQKDTLLFMNMLIYVKCKIPYLGACIHVVHSPPFL